MKYHYIIETLGSIFSDQAKEYQESIDKFKKEYPNENL